MRSLVLDLSVPSASLTNKEGLNPTRINLNQFYELGDGSRVIVRTLTDNPTFVKVELKSGRDTLQSVRVELTSSNCGICPEDGEADEYPYYTVVLDGSPLYPLGDLVNRLFKLGVGRDQITLMPTHMDRMIDCLAADTAPRWNTDSMRIKTDMLAPTDMFPKVRRSMTVDDPAWVITKDDDGLWHVYLWPAAVKMADDIVDKISSILASATRRKALMDA